MKASIRLLPEAFAKPFHAGDAYTSLDMTVDTKTLWSVVSGMPCARSTFKAKSDWAQLPKTASRCSLIENLLDIVTPSILIASTRVIPGIAGGGGRKFNLLPE